MNAKAPTIEQVAKVAKINPGYLRIIVNELCEGLNIELPERRGGIGPRDWPKL